jgi:hypothetical protein
MKRLPHKRISHKRPSTSCKHAVTLDTAQLNCVRGGLDPARYSTVRGGLDIAVRVTEPPAAYMSLQHNELLITQ